MLEPCCGFGRSQWPDPDSKESLRWVGALLEDQSWNWERRDRDRDWEGWDACWRSCRFLRRLIADLAFAFSYHRLPFVSYKAPLGRLARLH